MRTIQCMFHLATSIALTILLLALPALLEAQANPLAGAQNFAGIYTDGNLKLELAGSGTAYSGSISIQGSTFPLRAAGQGSDLNGTFSANGQDFPFVARWNGSELFLESGGTTYRLRRQQPAARNPLAAGGANPSVSSASRAASGNPAAGAPVQAGEFLLRLPAGWSARDDGSGDVALLPPGFNPQGGVSELYVAMAPGYESLRDPEIMQEAEEDYIPEAARRSARKNTREFQANGRNGLIHTWSFARPDNGQPITLAAYLVEADGEVLEILATIAGELPAARDQALQQIAGAMRLNASGAGSASASGSVSPQPQVQPSSPVVQGQSGGQAAPPGARTGIQTHPQAPPIVPGQLSDNNPQSLQWVDHLRGKMLSKYDRGSSGLDGGWTSQEKMLLYPDGRFVYSSSNQFSIDTGGAYGSGAGRDGKSGTWRILTANGTSFLALVYQGSNAEEYAELDFRENKTFIDGSRVLVTAPQ